jgi:hypothetical protein
MSRGDLISMIQEIGTDRYDVNRKQIFDAFYQHHHIDFFGTVVTDDQIDAKIPELKKEFVAKTEGDRAEAVTPDIAIIYDADQCEMVENVYEGVKESDCFRFKVSAKDALKEVIEI